MSVQYPATTLLDMAHFRSRHGSRRPTGRLPWRGPGREPVRCAATGAPAGVVLRDAGPDALRAARALHGRCSPATLDLRYPGGAGEADRYLTHLLDLRHGRAAAAWTARGELVGLGHLLWDGDGGKDEAEVAVLVADGWQRCGIGAALLRRLLGLAAHAGCDAVYAVATPGNAGFAAAMAAVARDAGLPLERQASRDALVLAVRLVPLPLPFAARSPGAVGDSARTSYCWRRFTRRASSRPASRRSPAPRPARRSAAAGRRRPGPSRGRCCGTRRSGRLARRSRSCRSRGCP
jgi:GNAT superfamily N-acetyltransferase